MKFRNPLTLLLFRVSVIFITAGVLLLIPEPNSDSILHYKNAVVVLAAIVLGGKLLYDTLFYDRYY